MAPEGVHVVQTFVILPVKFYVYISFCFLEIITEQNKLNVFTSMEQNKPNLSSYIRLM